MFKAVEQDMRTDPLPLTRLSPQTPTTYFKLRTTQYVVGTNFHYPVESTTANPNIRDAFILI